MSNLRILLCCTLALVLVSKVPTSRAKPFAESAVVRECNADLYSQATQDKRGLVVYGESTPYAG